MSRRPWQSVPVTVAATPRLVHQIIERAIRHAQAADLVGRNVASLVTAPEGKGGRPSRP